MMIYDSWEIPPLSTPFALTLGFFDGVHLGHKTLLDALQQKKIPSAVLTFSNHPGSLLASKEPPPLLTSTKHKLELLRLSGIDLVFLLPFTRELASLSFDEFLKKLHDKIPFSHLIHGKGDAFGRKRAGDEKAVKEFGQKMGFEAHYLEKHQEGNELISSSRIRTLVKQGDLATASRLLGRPYALDLSSLSTLCLPPDGTYRGLLQGKEVSFSLANGRLLENYPQHQLLEFTV